MTFNFKAADDSNDNNNIDDNDDNNDDNIDDNTSVGGFRTIMLKVERTRSFKPEQSFC